MLGVIRKILMAVFGNPEADQLRQALLSVQRDLEQSERQVKDLERCLDDLRARLALMQRTEKEHSVEAQRLKDRIEDLEDDVRELTAELDRFKNVSGVALAEKQAELERVIKEAAEAAEAEEGKLKALGKQLEAAQLEQKEADQQLKRAHLKHAAEFRKIQEEAEALRARLEDTEAAKKKLEKRLAAVQAKLRRDEELTTGVLKAEKIIESLEATIHLMGEEKLAQTIEKEKMAKKMERLQADLAKEREALLALRQTVDKAENSLVQDQVELSVGLMRSVDFIQPGASSDGDN